MLDELKNEAYVKVNPPFQGGDALGVNGSLEQNILWLDSSLIEHIRSEQEAGPGLQDFSSVGFWKGEWVDDKIPYPSGLTENVRTAVIKHS